MSQLPAAWRTVRLEEVCEVNPRHPGPDNPATEVSFVPMPAVSDVEGVILPHESRPFSKVAKGYTRFRDGDVIFAKITPCMENGKVALASGLKGGIGCGSTEFHVLRANGPVLPAYLWRFLRQDSFREEAQHQMTGAVGQRRVPTQFLKQSTIPLPPLVEQRGIVAKLDNVFARSKSARDELSRIPRLVERYKQAVLAAAFRGQLTADDADRWPVVSLGDVIAGIDAGKNIRCEERPPKPSERGIVKVSSVTWGTFDPLAAKTPDANARLDLRSLIQTGDFLISRANTLELVGACVVVGPFPDNNLYLSDKILRIRFTQPIEHWVLHFLRSAGGRNQIEGLAIGNQLSMRNISQATIRAIRMPLPPEDVRKRVLDSVQKALAAISATLKQATRATDLLHRLDQATLAKAFRGELVPPNEKSR